MKRVERHHGVVVPLDTPITAEGRLDETAGRGKLLPGTTGECTSLSSALILAVVLLATTRPVFAGPPLSYEGPEATTAADGGLQPVVGVWNSQVYRANRSAPPTPMGSITPTRTSRCSPGGAVVFTSNT